MPTSRARLARLRLLPSTAHHGAVSRAAQPPSDYTCSPLLLPPLLRLLGADANHPELRDRVAALVEQEDRVPVLDAAALIDDSARVLGDPDLGLRAALFSEVGDFAALEWVAMSAPTWDEATRAACRYGRVLSESADFRLERVGDRSHLILGSLVPISRVTADFQVAAYSLAIRMHTGREAEDMEVWFEHPRPADVSVYAAVFPNSEVVFGAPFNGFNMPAGGDDEPLETGNASLHGVLREHAERLLEELAPGESLVTRVAADILAHMGAGHASAERTAARLAVSGRTLVRQLAEHGTSYTELLKQTRYRTAIHYLRHDDRTIEDIAFLLGFSECGAFVRAFRRWSGQTPLEYRRSCQP